MLRITGGVFNNRKIKTPKGAGTRPTIEKTRQAVFNILTNYIDFSEVEVFDLFAGSGAYGFESLSRRAKKATFLDSDRNVARIIKDNIKSLGVTQMVSVHVTDTVTWLKKTIWEPAPSLFFLDPPYASNLLIQALETLHDNPTGPEKSILVLETSKKSEFILPNGYKELDVRVYGNTRVYFAELNRNPILK